MGIFWFQNHPNPPPTLQERKSHQAFFHGSHFCIAVKMLQDQYWTKNTADEHRISANLKRFRKCPVDVSWSLNFIGVFFWRACFWERNRISMEISQIHLVLLLTCMIWTQKSFQDIQLQRRTCHFSGFATSKLETREQFPLATHPSADRAKGIFF